MASSNVTTNKAHDITKDRPASTVSTAHMKASVEDVTFIWFDQFMDETDNAEDVQITKVLLKEINDYVLFISKPDECLAHIESVPREKIFLIISGYYALTYLDRLHPLKQIDSIFIFCVQYEKYLPLMKKYSKIIDVFVVQQDLMQALLENVELITRQAAVFGLFDGNQRSTRYLTRESASFLWFQLLTEVLRKMAANDKDNLGLQEMLEYCRVYYRGNRSELDNIEDFRVKYKQEDAIRWYSKQAFVYKLVNKALRTEDINALYTFRVYITHLRNRIAHDHRRLRRVCRNTKVNMIRLYRGLKMTEVEIQRMRENEGGLISMNGFFSTSRDMDQAVKFATKKATRKNVIGVLLEIFGDVNLDTIVFADIADISEYPQEQEVLFDLGTIFRIVHVEYDGGRNLWVIQLAGAEKSETVNEYLEGVGKEMEESSATLLFGRLMCDMGEYDKSEKYLKRMLATLPNSHPDIPKLYFHLGRASYFRGQYKEALGLYEHALALQKFEVRPSEQSIDIARTLHNIGNIYFDQQDFQKALDFYQRALDMKRATLTDSPDHTTIAITTIAIGSVYQTQGKLDEALKLFQEALEMKKRSLPADHPSVADSLNSLGVIYQEMDEYDKALKCFRQSLEIKQKSLPPSHPSLSDTLNNMATIYRMEGDYKRALDCYNKALRIEQTSLPADHLTIAGTYSNLSLLYCDLCQFEKALEMCQLRLNILQKHFDINHKSIVDTKTIIDDLNEQLAETSNKNHNVKHGMEPLVYL